MVHDNQVSLFVTTVYGHIQIAHNVMAELNNLSFARPLTSETMLTVSKKAFKG